MSIRRFLRGLLLLATAAVLAAAVGLAWAHRSIRAIEPPLPRVQDLYTGAASGAAGPVRLAVLNTASQQMPRGSVLDSSLDPNPSAPFVMSFPSFVLEWADGRIFLIDLGMDRAAALEFGAPSERLIGAGAIEAHADVAERLGRARARVAGVAFTHLHTDHTQGALGLCDGTESRIPVFQTSLQASRVNYTTRAGADQLAQAGCLAPRRLEGGPLHAIPGFPGLYVFATGGHTPGSQIFVANVGGANPRTWIFTGDAVNQIDGVRLGLPKPTWYSLFIVPENRSRMKLLRDFLLEASRPDGVGLLVSHDRLQLEAAGLPAW